jgi:hypothetical protein
MSSRAVTHSNLGAWLIKCDPRVNAEVLRPAGSSAVRVTSRCVARGYRSSMMKEGDHVVIWVSGDGRLMSRGIWGVGHVVGAVDASAAEPFISVDIPLFTTALTDADLRAAHIDDLEVQRMPAASNPSWVSQEQWARIERLLGQRDG